MKSGPNLKVDLGYFRHLILNSLRATRVKYFRDFGELVICCDGDNYWRKSFFPLYKANRKKDREDSKLDWENIFMCLDTVRQELLETFPYPVVKVSGAEGDDVIATLAEWSQTNDLANEGMWEGDPKPFLIISADGDGVQNQRYSNVKQYSPIQKKWLVPQGMSVVQYIADHIAEGDTTDGIPNVLSADNCIVDKIRQKSLRKERRAEFVEKGIDACLTEEERKNYIRNQTLIDFSYIPENIKTSILTEFLKQREICKSRGRMKVMNYFVKHKMSLMLECLNEF